jgi:ABC-type microcin C transport system permease subunit YejE
MGSEFFLFYFGTAKGFLSGNIKFFFQEFEGIECEWPLFYMFMIIDGVFKAQSEQIEEYQNLLKSKIKRDINGGTVNYLSFR